jgi:PAS domain S-box-containing protein
MQWSRSVFELFLGTLPDAAIVVEAGHLIVLANPRAAELFGCPRHELVGESVATMFPARTDVEAAMRWFFAPPPDPAMTAIRELTLRRRDGQLFSAEVTRGPVTVEGQPVVLAIVRDVSERKRGDDELRKSEERLRQAVRVSEIGIFDHDHRTDIHYWSPQQRQLYGWGETEEVTVPSFLAILHPDDRAGIATAMRNAHDPTGDGFFDVEHRIKHRDGGTRWIATRSRTLFSAEGAARRPVRTVGASVDLTERKLAEEALDLFRHSVDQASEAIFWLDRDGRFSYVNERACRSLGYTRDELMRLRVWDIDVTYPRALWDERWERFERLHESVTGRAETFHQRKDGTAFPVEVVCQHIPLQGRSLHIAYARDISERRQAEEARERLVAILDATPDFVNIAAPDGRLLYLNQSARTLLGIAPGENISERRMPHDQPEWARRLILETAIPAAVRDGMWKGEAAFLDKGGREVPFSLVLVAHKSADARSVQGEGSRGAVSPRPEDGGGGPSGRWRRARLQQLALGDLELREARAGTAAPGPPELLRDEGGGAGGGARRRVGAPDAGLQPKAGDAAARLRRQPGTGVDRADDSPPDRRGH